MPSLRKKIAISAASAALALAYPAEAAVQANTNACYPDSGYAHIRYAIIATAATAAAM